MAHYVNFVGGHMARGTGTGRGDGDGRGKAAVTESREIRTKDGAAWTRLHDLSLGLVVGILVLLVLVLVTAAGWGQARDLSNAQPTFWGMVRPEAEELAAVGFAGSGMGAGAFVMDGRTMPKLHGPMWHVADVEGGCFTADGGNGSMVYHLTEYFGIAGDGARVWAPGSGTSSGTQGLNLTTYLGGPQVSALLAGHLLPFGHFLLGKAQADGLASQKAAGSSSAFADAWGGGVDLVLNHDTSVRLAEIDEEFTHFRDAVGPRQSNLRLVFGVVFHFKTR
jgi:hypothetical protein